MEPVVEKIISSLSNKIFIISDLMNSKLDFNTNMEVFYDYLKQGFEIKELRTCPVHFKFSDKEGSQIHTLQLRHFLTNYMFWGPLVGLGFIDALDETYIVDCTKLSAHYIKEYIDYKIVIPFRKKISNTKMNKALADMIFNLSRISTDFNIILAMSINIETFIDVAERNPRFNEIIRTHIDDNLQPTEIETTLDNLMREQVNILENDPGNNMLKPILRSGSGIKHKQLAEFAISGGLKPDLAGNTIPIPINSNFIVGGLSNITNYYIDSIGGRKSLIMTKMVMGRSGHFARLVMLLVSGIQLSPDVKSCNSVHSVRYEVKTKEHLRRLQGRYYRFENTRTYSIIEGHEKGLVGRIIYVKSPATCASTDGICHECYGELYHTNKDITIGGFAGSRITEPVSQRVLSTKHLLTTVSEKIEFNKEFYTFFTITANEIIFNVTNDDIDLNEYSLIIITKNINTINEFDDTDFNTYIPLFHVKHKKSGELIECMELNLKDLYIAPDIVELMNRDKSHREAYEIDFTKIDDDARLFAIEVENNELTRPLYDIMSLLNKSTHVGCTTVDELCQKMLDLLIESNIDADAVHGEVIINPLLRSTGDILMRPDFSKYGEKSEYTILTVLSALEKHPSVLIGLSFQALGRQLINPLTFRKKSSSYIDSFFKQKP